MRIPGHIAVAVTALTALLPAGAASAAADTPAGAPANTPIFAVPDADIAHSYSGDFPFIVGGGVAAFDCDGDRLPELAFAGGAAPARLYRNEGTPGGDLRFAALATPALELRSVTGIYPLDIDGDANTDLVVLRDGENVVLRGLGGCRFTRANERWSFDGGDAWSTGMSATWERGSDWPTLAIANYVDRIAPDRSEGPCADNRLLRPNAAGDGFAPAHALSPGHCALSILFSDWNGDGIADLRISNDRQYYRDGEEQLWRMAPRTPPRPFRRDEGWQRLNIWGMGIASRDITGDGRPEYFLTSMADNKLRTLAPDARGAPSYTDIAFARGATAHRPTSGPDTARPSTAWHAAFADMNNDARDDLFIVKGNVSAMPDFARHDPNVLLLADPDGRFVDVALAAGLASPHRGRGGAVADLNGDGRLDITVVNAAAPVEIRRNDGPAGNWIAVDLRQPGGNRNAVGARIEVVAPASRQVREVTVGGGHASGVLAPQHFGLGGADRVRVRVRWPHAGGWSEWRETGVNRTVVFDRIRGIQKN